MRRLALAVLAYSMLATGCAYEFSDKYWITDAKLRRDVQKPLHDLHDLDKGTGTVIILREGMNIGSGETLKLNIELQKFEVGKQIGLPSDDVVVRFSMLDGIPANSGSISNLVLDGTIVVLSMKKKVLEIQVDMTMQMANIGGSSDVEEAYIEGKWRCQRITSDLEQVPPYYGGQQGIYNDDPPPRRDD